LTEVDQRAGIERRHFQIQAQRQLPAQVVFEHLHRCAVGHPLHELQEAHAQQQYRLDPRPAVAAAIRRLQRWPGLDQQRVNARGKQPEAIILGELVPQQVINAVQRSLTGELGKAHP
jgi:hypothetical protein